MNLLEGNQVRLTAVHPTDIPTLSQWWQSAEFLRHYDALPAYPQTEAQLSKRMETTQTNHNAYLFAIRRLHDETVVGIIELDGILWSHRTSWISLAIGSPTDRRQGIGTDALQILLRYAFHELNLYRLQLTVFSYNLAAIRLYQKLGFVQEGVFRQHLQRDGQRHDMLLYGLLFPEWNHLSIPPQ